jgi:hypothetical protein
VDPKVALAVFLSASCKRAPDAQVSIVEPAPSALTSSSAAPGSISPTFVVKVGDYTADRALVERWNEALNAHDIAALTPLYDAKNVVYYGAKVDRAGVTKRLSTALAHDPAYRQTAAITSVETYDDDEHVTVYFTKRNGDKSYEAYLVVARRTLTIDEESDRTTNKNLVNSGACVSYDSPHTFVGTLSKSSYIHKDTVDQEEYITFDRSMCVIELDPKANEGAQPQAPRSDWDGIFLQMKDSTRVAAALDGKHVAATGTIGRHAVTDATNNWLYAEKIVVR